ncbi:hypothetical protein F0562_009412 [Nyssa sinensis]|uniref:Telomere-associated protein Rif1 N-terminal domain-containing protein n=1 Tax=Nyssa sinensis TaxID=561372 RepID=A0A5J4ZY69_9ASTE|nr:hypothetical protein F0562_009412 [Nyssa sinensis]
MATFSDQLVEVKTLLSSNTKSHKPFAYSTLLHLQEQSNTDASLLQSLADSSRALLSLILTDISDDDEEIAAQALKCLGFMIYHPSLVVEIPGDEVNLIVDLLAKVLITTKMKSICNLGVWCISIQQFNASFLAAHFHSLLRAIIHALDNPIGSLSTTFEAIEAVMKLATQLSEKMRDTSNIWAPPIYRRLVSIDKRERDMSERCLLKIRLTSYSSLVNSVQGSCHRYEEKIASWNEGVAKPWHEDSNYASMGTFSDIDPQVQIASLVAWEGLIDALIHSPRRVPETNMALEHGVQQLRTSNKGNNGGAEANGLSKSIKLSNDTPNRNHVKQVIKTVWEPIFEAVFRVGPESKNIWSWNFCLDLLNDFILASGDADDDLSYRANDQLSAKTPVIRPPTSCKYSLKHYPIKCMAWDLSQLDFCIKMIHILISQGSEVTVSTEFKSQGCDAALRIFRSVLKGVQNALKDPAISYCEVMSCLNTIFRFIKMYEDVTSEESGLKDLHHYSLRFLEIVTEELEPSILGSPLYKVALDLKYIDNLQSVNETKHASALNVCSTAYMAMVSPIVYLTILYFCEVFKSIFSAPKVEFILQGVHKYLKFVLSSYDPLENLNAIIGLLYKHMEFNCLKIWLTIAKGLKDYIDDVKDGLLLKPESDSTISLAACHLLSYPFSVCSFCEKQLTMVKTNGIASLVSSQSQTGLELERVVEVWKSVYVSVHLALQFESFNSNRFAEDLFSILNGFLDEKTSTLEGVTELDQSYNNHDLDGLSLYGGVLICVLEHIQTSAVSSKGSSDKDDGDYKRFSGINKLLGFIARFMRLSWTKAEKNPPTGIAVNSRVFSVLVHFVGCLHLKEDILPYIEIISSPLLQWLSCIEAPYENTNHQIQLLWTETLSCLQRSWPPIIFDSTFLELQAQLLERTLDHPNPSISEPTITFWNSTYGEQLKLDYPPSLLHVLDKLSRAGRLNLCRRSPPFVEKDHSRVEVITAPQRYRVTATHNRSSKRVEIVKDAVNALKHIDNLSSSSKRKRAELTEHQKEVRRAQQGRERDCNRRGPGIRTYTGVDFSQGNEESQDSQEIRDPESILEMLRRAC